MKIPKWEKTILDKLGILECGKPLTKTIGSSESLFFNGWIPLIDGESVSKSRLYIYKSNRYFNFQGLKQNKLFNKGTVCFIRCGASGDSAILKYDSCLTESVYNFNPKNLVSDSKFIKYCFDFHDIKKKLINLSVTTTRKILSFQKLSLVKFPNPPYEIQRKIGATLSAYDELVESLEEQIELLEKTRDSFYKEWFIKLRFPNYEEFPLINGLPKNWKFMKLKDISEITRGTKPSSHSLNIVGGGLQETYPFFTCDKQIKRSLTFSFDFQSILFSSGGNYLRARICRKKFEASVWTYVIRSSDLRNFYITFLSMKNYHLPKLDKTLMGTAFKNLTPNQIKNLKILIPDQETLEKFNTICEDIQLQIENLQEIIEECEITKKDLLNRIFSQKLHIN